MSEEDVEIVRSIYEAFNRRDWDAVFRDAHPDFELTTPPGINAGRIGRARKRRGTGRASLLHWRRGPSTPRRSSSAAPERGLSYARERAYGSSPSIARLIDQLWFQRNRGRRIGVR
jgi:ketosteroid isomerase-like protein